MLRVLFFYLLFIVACASVVPMIQWIIYHNKSQENKTKIGYAFSMELFEKECTTPKVEYKRKLDEVQNFETLKKEEYSKPLP